VGVLVGQEQQKEKGDPRMKNMLFSLPSTVLAIVILIYILKQGRKAPLDKV
jgi:hypothetical protein